MCRFDGPAWSVYGSRGEYRSERGGRETLKSEGKGHSYPTKTDGQLDGRIILKVNYALQSLFAFSLYVFASL